MSTQRGNVSRTRPQKYQNKTKFKNDLHDKSYTIKNINKLEVSNVCSRCKDVIEWKIKYKKYKPLRCPATCVRCHKKDVKHAYHILCEECVAREKICAKCGKEKELIQLKSTFDPEQVMKSPQVKSLLEELTERKRRLFYRLLQKPDEHNLYTEELILEKLHSLQIGGSSLYVDTSLTDSSSECDS